jgi:hypothetical protein
MTSIGGSRPSVRERRGEGRSAQAGPRWTALGEADQAGQLGRAGGKDGKADRPVGLGPRGRKRERGMRKRKWAGPKEIKREKKNCI